MKADEVGGDKDINHGSRSRLSLTSGVVCDSFGKHCLPTPGWAIHEYPSRRVDANLLVQLEVG